MKTRMRWEAALLVALALPATAAEPGMVPGPAQSVGLYVYPQKKQGPRQQNRDESECYLSARDKADYDPMSPNTPAAQSNAGKGKVARSTVGGAGLGAAAGAAAGNAGAGAAIGAGVGILHGARQRRNAQAQASNEAKVQQRQALEGFKRAMSSCLEARGYSVK